LLNKRDNELNAMKEQVVSMQSQMQTVLSILSSINTQEGKQEIAKELILSGVYSRKLLLQLSSNRIFILCILVYYFYLLSSKMREIGKWSLNPFSFKLLSDGLPNLIGCLYLPLTISGKITISVVCTLNLLPFTIPFDIIN
jgi:hypothetical protein